MKKIFVTLLLITLFSFKLAEINSLYHIPMAASAVCAADYDLDGDLDIVVNHGIDPITHWGGIYMLQNDGYGNFMFMDSIYDSVGWVNYVDTVFNKTIPDIVYNYHDSITILSTDGENYTRSLFYIGPHVNDFALGDVDNSGYLDVVFISNWEQYWGVIFNQGNNSFTAPVYYDLDYPPTDIVCDDLNNDGRNDVVIMGSGSEIFFSYESGFEEKPLQNIAGNVRIADLDNDGDKDIITFSDIYAATLVFIFENKGDNIFDSVNFFRVPEGCSDFFVTDFNNDSLPDALFLTHNFNKRGYILYYNLGNFEMGGSLEIDLPYYGEARRFMYCADMDGNGYTDIITTGQVFDIAYTSSPLEILFNDGHGNFDENPLTFTGQNRSPDTIGLHCYPNPFSNKTNIEYTFDKKYNASLIVFDLNGRKIKTLINKRFRFGEHKTTWNGTDKN